MSYRCAEVTISKKFFEKHSKCVTIEPDDSIFRGSISSGHPMDYSENADLYRKFCAYKALYDVSPFLPAEMIDFIKEKGCLFAFALLYNNENRTKHIRIFISASPELDFRWVRCINSIWPYLDLINFESKGPIGMIDCINSGVYDRYIYGHNEFKDFKFSCTPFDFTEDGVKVLEYDRIKNATSISKDKAFEIIDPAGIEDIRQYFDK